MAKKYLDDSITYDEGINSLSLEGINLFVRMIVCSDDFGIIPVNIYELNQLCGIQEFLRNSTKSVLDEIVSQNLGWIFDFKEKKFLMFKPEKFDKIQSHLVSKRTKSKYLDLSSEKVQEIRRNYPLARTTATVKSIKNLSKEKSKIKRDTLAVENLGGSTSDSSIPQILNSSSPDIPSQVITVIHRIGQELDLPAYAAVTDKAWRPKLVRWGQKIGYQCLLRQAEALENWLAGRPDKKKLSANQRTNPTAQFFNTWLPRVFEKDYTSGDSIMPVEKSNGYHSEVEELGSQKIISHDQHV